MPYDPSKDPWQGVSVSPVSLGRSGALVSPSDTEDLPRYARLLVFVPAGATASVRLLPIENGDDAPLTLPLPAGQASVPPFLVRRVFSTGTTAGLTIHTID